MSSFNPNIPQVTDSTLQSFAQIRANFQAINNAFSDNHVPLTSSSDITGMHNVLTLRPQTGDPTTSATQTALYNKLVSSIPEMFFRPNSDQTPIQLTYPSLVTGGLTQYSFVAGPFIIYGGFINLPTNGQTVTLSPGSQLLYVDLTMAFISSLGSFIAMAVPTSISGTSFKISFENIIPPVAYGVYYFAIGAP